ncbi:Fe-S cluster assembly ATPase SufC [Candidatus Marinamargulisbacteria bacterium SCGC AG-410-N11]|nr:Fe-S cluster assembly ATPase SufC [Candidatus Marinamargulisbacteria bacterium SCGC AG-410-N11]
MTLEIKNLQATINDTPVLKGVDLTVEKGKVHAIMGPNGSGKSTLAKVLCGHPDYEVTGGQANLNGKDLLELDPDERSLEGLFMAFQYPVEIPGVNNSSFLRMAYNAKRKYQGHDEVDPMDFEAYLEEKLKVLSMKTRFLDRAVNHGFSGGEKKRNEILQMLVLDPDVVVLDETDSGLDIDAMKVVSEAVNFFKSKNKSIIVITHYQRLLNYIKPDIVHVLADGKIAKTGEASLALELEDKGYDGVFSEATV